jgi:hypothetical protein
MFELHNEPAQTYQFNVLASAIGRFAPPNIDSHTINQSVAMFDNVVEVIREQAKPPVPHTCNTLLDEAMAFDLKLNRQLKSGPAAAYLSSKAISAAVEIVTDHVASCQALKTKDNSYEMLIDAESVAINYGLYDMWTNTDNVILEEAAKWSAFREHPEVGSDLLKKIGVDETKNMMSLMWTHIIGISDHPKTRIYSTDSASRYHLYWAPLYDTLDYATPASYDRATQLSFDLPHNAAHLAHLGAMKSDLGVYRYNDCMAQRAYFEAVAVLSEFHTFEQAQTNTDFTDEMYNILKPNYLTKEALADWVVRDRGYEFKLRAARYAADVMMINGQGFSDTIHSISETFDIPLVAATKEAKKYLPWTGLGSIYSCGYKKLQSLGIRNTKEAITNSDGGVITSWAQITEEI